MGKNIKTVYNIKVKRQNLYVSYYYYKDDYKMIIGNVDFSYKKNNILDINSLADAEQIKKYLTDNNVDTYIIVKTTSVDEKILTKKDKEKILEIKYEKIRKRL